jgi:hypothetical protein
MPLRGLLYRKLKKRMEKRKKKSKPEKFENIKTKNISPMPVPLNGEAVRLKGSARYWGGHFLYPIKTVEMGEIEVNKNSIMFVKYGLLKRPEWSIEIPLGKVEWKKVSQAIEEDGIYSITCFTIPFKDEKGIRHQPKFSIETSSTRELFSKFLYERLAKRNA